jgi:hypothetical protein
MYKNKLSEGELDAFSPEEIARMEAELEEKRSELLSLYTTENKINL